MTLPRSLALLLPLALLAGCNKSAENDKRSASGEVLQGTISDSMLPLDKLKSEPPLLAPSETAKPSEGGKDEAGDETAAPDAASGEPEAAAPAPQATASGTP